MTPEIFSYSKDSNHRIFRIFGIKISLRNNEPTGSELKIQDEYQLDNIKNAKFLNVFFIPDKKLINGGILSIYSICKCSREICPDAECVICTVPGKFTYSHNPYFKNNEKIYRWEQIIKNINNTEKLILHIPEYFAGKFYKTLTQEEKEKLKSIPDLQINILNQNIELMPSQKKLNNLYKLTKNITQTIGHDRYASAEICNKWTITPHFLSVYIEGTSDRVYSFEEKEKTIVLSPDKHPMRENIITSLKKDLPEFNFVTVENLKYSDYIDLIARSLFTITFGEGFDGYFNQPLSVGSLSFAVYNDEFFPDKSWKELDNVYSSFDEMKEKIAGDMKQLLSDSNKYNETVQKSKEKKEELYSKEKFMKNLRNFYAENYIING